MSEVNAIDRWIFETLTGDAALTAVVGTRIYVDMAPQTNPPTPMPYVVYNMQAANDLMVVGAIRVWANALYTIRAIDEVTGYTGSLKTVAERIDALLHGQAGSNAYGDVWAAVRERPFRMTEVTNGRRIAHAGGIYRILAR